MGRSTTRSRPRMSRRQTDLEPGVEPDAGETGALPRRRPNGRPPTPAAGVASRPAPARGPPERRPARRRAARRTTADRTPPTPLGGGSSPSLRWVPWIVLALIAAAFIVSSLAGGSSSKADLTYSQFVERGRRRQRQEHRLQQVERRDQRQVRRTGRRQDRVLELGPEGQPARPDARDDQQEEHRLQLRRRGQQHPRRHPAVGAAARR